MKTIGPADATHQRAVELLPWLVNDTLDGSERAWLDHHVMQCAACKREMVALRRLRQVIQQEHVDGEIHTRLQRMHRRLDALAPLGDGPAAPEKPGATTSRRPSARSGAWLSTQAEEMGLLSRRPARRVAWSRAWQPLGRTPVWQAIVQWRTAAIAQAVLLAGLAVVALDTRGPALAQRAPGYHVLSSTSHEAVPADDRAHVALSFDGRCSLDDMQALLRTQGAAVVAGPNDQGVYEVALPARTQAQALKAWRASPWVRLAQPVLHSSP